jgi:hypothetical protein
MMTLFVERGLGTDVLNCRNPFQRLPYLNDELGVGRTGCLMLTFRLREMSLGLIAEGLTRMLARRLLDHHDLDLQIEGCD